MKRFLIIILFVLPAVICLGQKKIEVTETAKKMSQGLQPAFVVNIPETEIRDVERDWKRLQQKGTRSRVEQEEEEMKLSQAGISGVPGESITVYSRLYADHGQTILVAFFEIDSAFFTPQQNPDIARSIRDYLRDFAVEEYREVVKSQLKDEEKKLQALVRTLESMRDEEKKNERIIKENEREIKNLKDEIEVNLSDEERKNEQIEQQKDMVEAVRELEEEHKAARKELRKLERDKKKIRRQRKNMYRKIDRLEAEIKRAKRDIRIGKEKQKQQEKVIKDQEEVVKSFQNKLDNIQ